jgi:hypothetical protein
MRARLGPCSSRSAAPSRSPWPKLHLWCRGVAAPAGLRGEREGRELGRRGRHRTGLWACLRCQREVAKPWEGGGWCRGQPRGSPKKPEESCLKPAKNTKHSSSITQNIRTQHNPRRGPPVRPNKAPPQARSASLEGPRPLERVPPRSRAHAPLEWVPPRSRAHASLKRASPRSRAPSRARLLPHLGTSI